jgi:putative transposase
LIFGEQHVNAVCKEFRAYYHGERPHQTLDNDPLTKPKKRGRPKKKRWTIEDKIAPLREVKCKERLGGLLKSYSRNAA